MEGRKRRQDGGGAPYSNGGFKKHKQVMEGIGSKSKPCTKFFSTSGCPFGGSCHFLHHVPGGYNAVAQMMNLPPVMKVAPPPPQPPNGSAATVKTRMCNRLNSAEGCKFGEKCHFAHSEWELNKPPPSFEDPRGMGGAPMHGRYAGRHELPAPTSFGEKSSTKISIDASLASAIIGKSGVNSKQISRQSGAKLSIRDHETNANLKNIQLEGTFDQIKMATAMVGELVANVSAAKGGPTAAAYGPQSNNYKKKLCDNFTKGSCTFGDRCHFAHGAAELRKPGV